VREDAQAPWNSCYGERGVDPRTLVAAAISALIFCTGCGGTPSAPSCTDQYGRGVNSPTALDFSCTPVGSDLQCQATATNKHDLYSYCEIDQVVTASTTWTSSNPSIATFNAPGMPPGYLKVLAAGQIQISAQYQNLGTVTQHVSYVVVPGSEPGRTVTFSVDVLEAGTAFRPVFDATVLVEPTHDSAQTCQTNFYGDCTFTITTRGSVRVVVSKVGYQTDGRVVDLFDSDISAVSMHLVPVTPQPVRTVVTISFFGIPNITVFPFLQTWTESGFTVSPTAADWTVGRHGNADPFIAFKAPPDTGSVQVTANGMAFSFGSIELYSSMTPIPYTITGVRGSSAVFTVSDTLPNTFGSFARVLNPNPADLIDTLLISLKNTVPSNSMGLDNITLATDATTMSVR
jgi:hypothetical protein